MFIPSTFNSMEDYGNLLLMRLLLRFLSFLFHYFINGVRKVRKILLNLQSHKCLSAFSNWHETNLRINNGEILRN